MLAYITTQQFTKILFSEIIETFILHLTLNYSIKKTIWSFRFKLFFHGFTLQISCLCYWINLIWHRWSFRLWIFFKLPKTFMLFYPFSNKYKQLKMDFCPKILRCPTADILGTIWCCIFLIYRNFQFHCVGKRIRHSIIEGCVK